MAEYNLDFDISRATTDQGNSATIGGHVLESRIGHIQTSTIVPIVAADINQAATQASLINETKADLVEFRADLLDDFTSIMPSLDRVKSVLDAKPIIFTFRTIAEGGGSISAQRYLDLVTQICQSALADAIDIEYRFPNSLQAIDIAKNHGMPVISSNHNFELTPPSKDIYQLLAAMASTNSDICKIAVTSREISNITYLLEATAKASQELKKPVITMGMGKLGAFTRLVGGFFGCAATFTTLDGLTSAPGQIGLEETLAAFNAISKAMR